MSKQLARLAASVAVVVATGVAPLARAGDVTFQDGRKVADTLESIADGEARLTAAGAVSLGLLRQVDLAPVAPSKAPHTVHLVGGDRLRGALTDPPMRGVAIKSALAGTVAVSTRQLAWIDFGGKEPLPGPTNEEEDVLIIRGKGGKLVPLKGAMVTLDSELIVFQWRRGNRKLSVKLDRARALRFGSAVAPDAADGLTVTCELTDGSVLTAEELTLDRKSAELVCAGGLELTVPRKALARLRVASDWVLFLAAHEPLAVERERLYEHRLEQIDWPAYRVGKDIYGRKLLGGATGIGTYGTTRLTWDIKARYQRFKAKVYIALPPGARPAASARRGTSFRVLADGESIAEVTGLTPGAPPKAIDADVTDVRRLTLIVDRGAGWGVGQAGAWIAPQVHK